MLQKPTSPLYL